MTQNSSGQTNKDSEREAAPPRDGQYIQSYDGSESREGAGQVAILIVDDEPRNLTVLESVLESPAYNLVRATSPDQALLALLAKDFAVAILDVQMPGLSGFELAQMIRRRKKTSQLPIIFLSAYYNEDEHVVEGYQSGAVDYLHKPVNPSILRSKVAVLAELYLNQQLLERANVNLTREVAERREVEEKLKNLNETLEEKVRDRTEAHAEAERQIRFLMEEVNHRSKNLLSLVIAIAQQTASSNAHQFKDRFAERLHALAVSHDLLVKGQWRSIELGELVRGQLAHFADLIGRRILVEGPALLLSAGAAQTIGMAIHELSTNAAKHGALSRPDGTVRIHWSLEPELFNMEWRETAGGVVNVPDRKGFGTTVLTRMASMNMGGEADMNYMPSGLCWRLRCPADGAISKDKA